MKIYILACDRPDYLIQSLDSINDGEVFVLLDKPASIERVPFHNQCKELLKKRGIRFDANDKNLGCSQSMYKLLSTIEDDVFMVLEEDVVLLPDYKEAFNLMPQGDFVLKLGGFFWGWIATKGAINKLEALRNGVFESTKHIKDPVYQSIAHFKEAGVDFLWDSFFQAAINFCDIKEVKAKKPYAKNIGVISSRKKTKQVASVATYVNGEFKGVTKI